jgi:hypothetical protein
VTDLDRKHSGGWDKEYPKCTFWSKVLRFRTFTVQCHTTPQITVSGKHKGESTVYNMESKKDNSPLNARFLVVWKKRGLSECERESEFIEMDTNITAPGANPSHALRVQIPLKTILVTTQCTDFIITFSSTQGKGTILPRRTVWTTKILTTTDDRLQQKVMWVMTPLYKEMVLVSRPWRVNLWFDKSHSVKVGSSWWKSSWPTRRSLHGA